LKEKIVNWYYNETKGSMKSKSFILILFISIPFLSFGNSKHSYHSKYVGQENREIKSLSKSDIDELTNGRGWGLAKAAELNGVPGPAHLLEMKEEINLSSNQINEIESLFQIMKNQAIPLGIKLVKLEQELNSNFADNSMTEKKLQELLEAIAQVSKQLRYVHLSTHLKTPYILTEEQISHYNKLRGYKANDPCENIPKGHNPEMWKKHNNCQ